MLKKSLLFGIVAALSAAFIFTACSTDVEYKDKIVEKEVEKEIPLVADTLAGNENALKAALGDPNSKIIALTGTATLSDDLDIPEGKTLILYAELDTDSSELGIAGAVKVGPDGVLTASSGGIATVTGSLEVYQGGTVGLDAAASLVGLGTDKVSFKGGALAADWPTNLASVNTAFGYVAAGILDLSSATLTSLKLSQLAGISGIGATRGLIATATEDEDDTSLSIPAGAALTANTSDDLGDITSLSVYGSLTATDATGASGGIAITVGPGASLTVGAIAKLMASTVAAGASLTTGDVTAFDGTATLTAYAGAAVNGITFPREAAISALEAAEVTINASLTLLGTDTLDLGDTADLALADDAVLSLPATATVKGSRVIKAEDGSGSITIAGTPGFTTTSTGVAGDDFATTYETLAEDIALLANNPALVLDSTFGTTSSVKGIGSAALTSSSEVNVIKNATAHASTGGEIEFDASTTLGTTVNPTAKAGTNNNVVTLNNVTLSIGSNKLQIADSDAENSTPKYAVVTFSGVQIANGELQSPALSFNIGIKTNRS
ncbi:MAG: hypothetical protein LBR93_06875 [Treponema sp.]|nr:hypothetical protein [Treponema sp.]